MDNYRSRGVPTAPNESIVCGELVEIGAGPDGMGSIWKVRVDDARDVGELPNFTRARVGETIMIYVHPEMRKEFKAGDTIEVNVSFQGDERGGAFFLMGEKVRKL